MTGLLLPSMNRRDIIREYFNTIQYVKWENDFYRMFPYTTDGVVYYSSVIKVNVTRLDNKIWHEEQKGSYSAWKLFTVWELTENATEEDFPIQSRILGSWG